MSVSEQPDQDVEIHPAHLPPTESPRTVSAARQLLLPVPPDSTGIYYLAL